MVQIHSTPGYTSTSKLLLFGSQSLSFDAAAFTKLCSRLDSGRDQWALDDLSGLAADWTAVVESLPKLRHVNGDHLLRELSEGLRTGELPSSLPVLPNILLTPLVIIT